MTVAEAGRTRPSVLITGCSTGIGRCAAQGLRARGYRVLASARKPADVAALSEAGFESLPLDLDDPASVDRAADQALERTDGALYALFNNGGFGQAGALEDLPAEALRAQFETNLFGWHALTRRVLPAMRDRGRGRLVQNSSVLGFVALKFRGAYNASKFAVEGWSDTLRLELAGTGIHVCLIEPGPIRSRFRPNSWAAFQRFVDVESSPHREAYRAFTRRLARPEGKEAPFTLPPEAVLRALVHALESPRPRARYPVTVPTRAFAVLRRVLPVRVLDRILVAASGGGPRG